MAASMKNSNYTNNNKLKENSHGSFDDYSRERETRSTRAASFGIPPNASLFEFLKRTAEPITNKFMLAPPSASTINIRRHSSHNCNPEGKNAAMRASRADANAATAATNTTDETFDDPLTKPPPSVPKRTFIGKLMTATSFGDSTSSGRASSGAITTATTANTQPRTRCRMANKSIPSRRNNHDTIYQNEQYSDDDRLSIESVFEEPKSSDPIILSKSNRSSSDSNKSHGTIDTGYMSSLDDRIFFGPSEDFRTRFSSVDTQSSLDSFSCLSTDSQVTQPAFNPNQARCIISPLAVKRDDGRGTPNGMGKMGNNLKVGGGAVDAMNNRRMTGTTNRIQVPPIMTSNGGPQRPRPPPPPMRPQGSLDSGKIFHNGSMLGAFQSGIARITSAASLTSEAVIGRKFSSVARQLSVGSGSTQSNPPASPKVNHRQDSTISNDSFSMTSSPGFNSKNMEAPLLQHASRINRRNNLTSSNESADSFGMTSRYVHSVRNALRQDSTVSSDSFSQTSSPGYNSKLSEQPLLVHAVKINALKQNVKAADEIHPEIVESDVTAPITKSVSTPASLQTIVRFQNGSNMSLQHKVINRRKSSNPYITQGRLKFRLLQILLNALALLIIAGGLAAYFRAYPTVRIINSTIIAPQRSPPPITLFNFTTKQPVIIDKNPAPGVCLPIIVKFCQQPQVPYNYTIYPNYIGHFSQLEAEMELEAYDALVDVKCYELVTLFLCSLFVPKCGASGSVVPPCKHLCEETMRRCKFFLGVFSLELPEYLTCNQFIDSSNSNVCVGFKQVREAQYRSKKPTCSGFLCDVNRCLPSSYRCDGHVDCSDQTDETRCAPCEDDSIYCGENRCMSSKHVCDGQVDCPFGQDERNCMRLSERNGDTGKGLLEIYKVKMQKWVPACVNHWNPSTSPTMVCSMLGYNSVNSSRLTMSDSDIPIYPQNNVDTTAIWRMMQKKRTNLVKEFGSCPMDRHPVVDLTCSNYECGKIKSRRFRATTRVIGGGESSPGDWPFLAAILGGPEEVFYCAGVLIADQWVLTASHCIGNHSLHKLNDWTIQLGITRRLSHTYYGQRVKIQRVIPHPQYNQDVLHDNDVALFQLSKRVAFHEHLLPVCLPPPGLEELKPGTVCTVIGWGKREDKKAFSASYEPTVNEVEVPILPRNLCNEWLVQLNVTEGMICAGYAEGGKDACQGDSGGPLLCEHPNDREKFFVGGIVSWGVKCASPKLPGVYANVPKYVDWILKTMQTYSNVPVNRERNTYGHF